MTSRFAQRTVAAAGIAVCDRRTPAVGRLQRGFTLLEILLALVLMAFVMVGVWGALRAATRTIHVADALMARSEAVRTAQQLVRTQLESAQLQPYAVSGDERARMFLGDPQSVQFVATMPPQAGRGGLFVQTLELVRANGAYRLQLEYSPMSGDGRAAGTPEAHVLLDGLAGGKFQYLAAAAFGQPAAWRDDWQAVNGLPLAVRIHLDPARDARVQVPDMVIPLHTGEGYGLESPGANRP
jgi:general secretion pathway protein J